MKLLDLAHDELTSDSAALTLGALDEATADEGTDESPLAAQAAMILSAMDAAGEGRDLVPTTCERRESRTERVRYRKSASLKLFADPDAAEPWTLFLRDVEARAAGFICPDRMPLGYGGTLCFEGPDGTPLSVDVTLVRCRTCYGGWYEGALYFHRNQPDLLARLSG